MTLALSARCSSHLLQVPPSLLLLLTTTSHSSPFLTLHIFSCPFCRKIHKLTQSVSHLTLVLCQSFLLAVPLSGSLEFCLGFHFAPLFRQPSSAKEHEREEGRERERFIMLFSFNVAASFRRGSPDVHYGTDFLFFRFIFPFISVVSRATRELWYLKLLCFSLCAVCEAVCCPTK